MNAKLINYIIKFKIKLNLPLTEFEETLISDYWGNFNVRLGKKAAKLYAKGFEEFIRYRLNK